MIRPTLIATFTILISASIALANVIETEITRYVIVANQGGSVIDGPTQLNGPASYGPFDDYVESFAWDEFHGGSSLSYQESTVDSGVYHINHSVRTDAGGGTMGADIATGYAESFYEIKFILSEVTDFTVAGSYNAFGAINGATTISEIRIDSLGGGTPSQLIAYTDDDCCPSVSVNGTLLPGAYAFRATALAAVDHSFMTSYTEGNAEANITMTLDIPQPSVPGDLDCSGVVDLNDIGPFVLALLDPVGYSSAFPDCDINLADLSDDSNIDSNDIGPFVQCGLFASCP